MNFGFIELFEIYFPLVLTKCILSILGRVSVRLYLPISFTRSKIIWWVTSNILRHDQYFCSQIFSPYGVVEDVYLMRDEMKQSRGMLFKSVWSCLMWRMYVIKCKWFRCRFSAGLNFRDYLIWIRVIDAKNEWIKYSTLIQHGNLGFWLSAFVCQNSKRKKTRRK